MMNTEAIRQGREGRVAGPQLNLAGKVTIGFLVWLGIGALAGGVALVAKPDGSVMGFSTSLLAGSPFSDFLLPGLILGAVFGLGSLATAVAGMRHLLLAPVVAFAIGCGQMIWIAVQLLIIKEVSFLHPLMFGTGLVIAVASAIWGWPSARTWLAER